MATQVKVFLMSLFWKYINNIYIKLQVFSNNKYKLITTGTPKGEPIMSLLISKRCVKLSTCSFGFGVDLQQSCVLGKHLRWSVKWNWQSLIHIEISMPLVNCDILNTKQPKRNHITFYIKCIKEFIF